MMETNYLEKYKYLDQDPVFGKHIVLLCLAGSYAYGTNTKESDLDVRGIVLNSASDLLTNQDFKQHVDRKTDTILYSFNTFLEKCGKGDPHTTLMLGVEPEHYLYKTEIGDQILQQKQSLLSKRIAQATMTEVDRLYTDAKYLAYHLQYESQLPDNVRVYSDTKAEDDYEYEKYIDIIHCPVKDFQSCSNLVQLLYDPSYKDAEKMINRKLMQAMELCLIAIDILEKHEIRTYRDKEHDQLLSIRNGYYLDYDFVIDKRYHALLKRTMARLKKAYQNTTLPEEPNHDEIQKFMRKINKQIIEEDL